MTWLSEVRLIQSKNSTALLIVPGHLQFIAQSLEFLYRAYSIAKRIYPNITSIITVTGFEYELLQSGDLVLHKVEVNKDLY